MMIVEMMNKDHSAYTNNFSLEVNDDLNKNMSKLSDMMQKSGRGLSKIHFSKVTKKNYKDV